MVIEIHITDPSNKSFMIKNSERQHEARDELEAIKTNLLNTNEVTFCDITDDEDDENVAGRKRFYSEQSEDDSIMSSVRPISTKKKPKIPDGGYGWVIVLSSLCISAIQDGCSFSFGLIYTELLSYFNESKSKTAWVGSLFMAVPLLCGPIMSSLVDRYGCRKMTILGGILSSTGFVLASISPSIEVLYVTFGIIAGLGLGLGYVTAVVSIAFWFDKKRTFATGIGASGTGVGTFLWAPFTQWLIETYGWRGTALILAGTLLNICVFGSLMRDPDWMIEENLLESRSQSVQTFSNSSVYLDEIKKLIEIGAPKEFVLDTLMTNVNTEANQQILRIPGDMVASKKYQSEMRLPTFMDDHEKHYGSRRSLKHNSQKSPETLSKDDFINNTNTDDTTKTTRMLASIESLDSFEKLSSSDEFDDLLDASLKSASLVSLDEGYLTCRRYRDHPSKISISRYSLDEAFMNKEKYSPVDQDIRRSFRGNSLDVVYENEIFNPNTSPIATLTVPNGNIERAHKFKNHKLTNGNLKRNTSFFRYSNYLKNVRVHRNSIHYRGAMLNTHRYRLRASSCPNIYRNSMTTIARETEEKWYTEFVDAFKTMFDFSLFLQFPFAMMSASTFILFVWFIVPYFYITEHLLSYGYTEEDGANLISIIGLFNTAGMVILGWAGDQPWLNVTKTYACCLMGCGISVFIMPLAVKSHISLIILCVFFGITFASTFSFTPIILVRLVDLDDFTCAYGLILLVQGAGSLIGPPLAGIIYDLTNRWDDSFYAAGVFITISGLLAYLIGTVDKVEDDVEESADSEE